MIVEPFRSNRPDVAVHHTNTLCPDGMAIRSSERLGGVEGLDECLGCRSLRSRLAFGSAGQSLADDLRTLADAEAQAGFGMLVWHPDSDEMFFSEGAYAIHGLVPVPTMVPSEAMAKAVHPDDLEALRAAFTAVAEGKGDYEGRHRVVWPDGTTRWVLAKARLRQETLTEPKQVLATLVDITDLVAP